MGISVATTEDYTKFIAQFIEAELIVEGVKEEHAERISKKVAKAIILMSAQDRHGR